MWFTLHYHTWLLAIKVQQTLILPTKHTNIQRYGSGVYKSIETTGLSNTHFGKNHGANTFPWPYMCLCCMDRQSTQADWAHNASTISLTRTQTHTFFLQISTKCDGRIRWPCSSINLIYLLYTSACFHHITIASKWAQWRLKSPASPLFTQLFIQPQIKENIKALHHWPSWGEFTGDRWIPSTKGQ